MGSELDLRALALRRLAGSGRVVFAAALIWLGILGLMHGGAFAPIWAPVPKGLPARAVLAWATTLVSLAGGAGLLWPRTAPAAVRAVLVSFLLWFALLRVPAMVRGFGVETWFAAAETAVMLAGAWALDGRARRGAGVLLGLALIPFGLAHFLYLQNTAPLVPAWLPWHVGWAYFTGATFVAAGAALIAGVRAKVAASLATLQIGLFTLLVWVPIVARGANPGQWAEFVVSAALTAGAWAVADHSR